MNNEEILRNAIERIARLADPGTIGTLDSVRKVAAQALIDTRPPEELRPFMVRRNQLVGVIDLEDKLTIVEGIAVDVEFFYGKERIEIRLGQDLTFTNPARNVKEITVCTTDMERIFTMRLRAMKGDTIQLTRQAVTQ